MPAQAPAPVAAAAPAAATGKGAGGKGTPKGFCAPGTVAAWQNGQKGAASSSAASAPAWGPAAERPSLTALTPDAPETAARREAEARARAKAQAQADLAKEQAPSGMARRPPVRAGPAAARQRNAAVRAQESRGKALAAIGAIELQKAAPGASPKERQGVAALGKGHAGFLLRELGVVVPETGKGRSAALLEEFERSGGSPAGPSP